MLIPVLAISRQFIELLNGDKRVESEKGKGSEFNFYIKVKLADITEEPYNLKYHELIVHEPEYKVFPIPLIENHTDSRVITIVADILTELEDAVICLSMETVSLYRDKNYNGSRLG